MKELMTGYMNELMTGFSKKIITGDKELEFKFSLIHTVNSKRYFAAVTEDEGVTSFYMEQGPAGKWYVADKFNVVPRWVHALEPVLSEAIATFEREVSQVPIN